MLLQINRTWTVTSKFDFLGLHAHLLKVVLPLSLLSVLGSRKCFVQSPLEVFEAVTLVEAQ